MIRLHPCCSISSFTCSITLASTFTQEWLDQNIDFMRHEAILTELEDMGGYCDCEVLLNCYEDYEL